MRNTNLLVHNYFKKLNCKSQFNQPYLISNEKAIKGNKDLLIVAVLTVFTIIFHTMQNV